MNAFPDAAPAFPLAPSECGRFLRGRDGRPFLLHGDTAWLLLQKLELGEAREYFQTRRAQGFSAVLLQLTGFLGLRDVRGRLPFGPAHDFAAPDEGFFDHVDQVLQVAAELGLLLCIAPLWSGCCGEGWAGKEKDGGPKPVNLNGVEKCRELGEYLGRRFGHHEHVMWILGGDCDPFNAFEEIRALGQGLHASAPRQMRTYHASSSHSSTDVWPHGEEWLEVSMIYSYFRGFDKAWNKVQPDVYEVALLERRKTPVRPFFLGESTYEGEHDEWGSAHQARKQAWWALLSGACGHA